jgi:type I restriction enzyme, S subunit
MAGRYNAYPEYQDSGVKWLGRLPSHWEAKRLGQFFSERREKVSDKDYSALSVTMQGIVPQLDTAAKTDAGDNRKLVLKNDFVINSRSDRKGSSGVSPYDGSVSLISIVLEPRNIEPLYVHHLLRSYPFQEEFYRFGKGIVADLWSTNSSEMKNIQIPCIPLPEQKQIARFLDHETGEIDALIEKQQALIALLKEKRQAVISHAVTKGLNPHATMKDSGVELLGQIPTHWETNKFRYLFNLGKGLTITKENLRESGVPCVNYGEVHSKYGFEVDPRRHPLKCVSEQYILSSANAQLTEGDLIFADTSEDLEGAGNFTQLVSNCPLFAGYHTIIARPVSGNANRFLAYLLDSPTYRTQIRLAVKGVKVFSVTQAILRGTDVWLPPLDEQSQIAQFLDHEIAKIDQLIEKAEYAIELMQERRTALISAAVTGKIDVCDWEPPKDETG